MQDNKHGEHNDTVRRRYPLKDWPVEKGNPLLPTLMGVVKERKRAQVDVGREKKKL
jgi:hypothetical protein